MYVGKAKNLKSRVSSYFVNSTLLGEKTKALVAQIHRIQVVIVESELESLLLEAFYIKKYEPRYNVRMTDGKSYPLIRITIKDDYPKVLFARHSDDPKSLYFGPYPNSGSVKLVLKMIRKVFPFQSVPHHPKRICLYHHLGLCPCPPVFASPEFKKEYRKNIRNIIRLLEGQSKKILKEMERERNTLSKKEAFEDAQILQQRIQALQYITQPFHQPLEYDINPNLRTDTRTKELDDLRKILNHNGYQIENPIHKIECYDISHIQGTHTTASLVVSIDGERETSLYRRFKIRLEKTPDDFASMREVLTRRLKHTEWDYPDLLIVDGGKGQVSAALDVFKKNNINIPLIGLAKRIETIVIPLQHPLVHQLNNAVPSTQKESRGAWILDQVQNDNRHRFNAKTHFREVVIPHSVGAIKLLQRIRDEAHRFAITYHRNLRSKAATI